MSCQQNQQKCQIPAKCLPKCPPKCHTQAPAAPAPSPSPCPAPCAPPPDPSSACTANFSVSAFGNSCSLLARIPDVCLSSSDCCDREPSGCPSSSHSPGHCS